MALRARCDDDDPGDYDGACPAPDTRVHDAALLIGAVAPVVVALLKHGPAVWRFFAERLREPAPAPPKRKRKPRPRARK